MSGKIHALVTDQLLDLTAAQTFVSDPAHGAIDIFIGVVRCDHAGRSVEGITYDAHRPLAEKILHKICEDAQSRWPNTHYYAAHFCGTLPVGGISVIIAVGSAHRAESFEACRFVIEEIKRRMPIWKQEHYTDATHAWLPGHCLNHAVRPIVAGVVLAGGRSSRMGRNKALLPFRGRPMIEHMVALLQAAGCAEIFISGDVPGYQSIPDQTPYAGPAAAMTVLLERFADRYPRLLFAPVDMPLLEVGVLRTLLDARRDSFFADHALPCCLATGNVPGVPLTVKDLLSLRGAEALPLSSVAPSVMHNLNTPEEWERVAS